MADIDHVTLPAGGVYYIADAKSRSTFSSVMKIYDPTKTYKYGECIFDPETSKFYHCTYNMLAPEEWNSSHWEESSITQELLELKELLYKEIVFTALTVSPSKVELGSTLTSATLSYTLNKSAQSMTLDGNAISNTAASGTVTATGSWTASKTFSMTATDERNYTSPAKTVTLYFYNNVIWGAAAMPGTVNSAFVMGLSNKSLLGSRKQTISVTASANQHIWYAVPTRLGACTFAVGGFTGGFSNRLTVSVTNSSGYTENYYVYYSDNTGLGTTSVVVT